MTTVTLPCQSDLPHFVFQCDLDGQTYGFEFEWNERVSAWFGSLLDVAGNPLISGVRIVTAFPLFNARSVSATLPPGKFMAVDTSGQDRDPGLSDLGVRVQILYYGAT
jgi:hypothetical protein